MESILVASPVGTLRLEAGDHGLTACAFDGAPPSRARPRSLHLTSAIAWLDAYFRKRALPPLPPLSLEGTEFQRACWRALLEIPLGETRSYAELARAVKRPRAIRAVGQANHHNPIAIVIPCHRIVGSDGRLTGYGGGLDKKRWLLDHEMPLFSRAR